MKIDELISELEDVKEEHGNKQVMDVTRGDVKNVFYSKNTSTCWIS